MRVMVWEVCALDSKIPDFNSNLHATLNLYRHYMVRGEWEQAYLALRAANGMMPEEYRVQENQDEYDSLTRVGWWCICQAASCGDERPVEDVKWEDVPQSDMDIALKIPRRKQWQCRKCNRWYLRSVESVKKRMPAKMQFYRLVPEFPRRNATPQGLTAFYRRCETWCNLFYGELMAALTQFRLDYSVDAEAEVGV